MNADNKKAIGGVGPGGDCGVKQKLIERITDDARQLAKHRKAVRKLEELGWKWCNGKWQ